MLHLSDGIIHMIANVIRIAYVYTGMDKTSLDTSSGSLFVRDSLTLSGCPRHVGRNYVPLLFGVTQSNVDLRYYVIRDVIGI